MSSRRGVARNAKRVGSRLNPADPRASRVERLAMPGAGARTDARKLRASLLATTALVATGVGLSAAALAGPQQPTVAAGSASIAQSGTRTTVTQSSGKAIINWQSFSIGARESVRFAQPNKSAIALNRVQGPGSSEIYGSLSANGQVWLVNPNGVLVGPGAAVNVAGLVAPTSNLSDANFMAGKYSFDQPSANPNARVVNQGTINIAPGGYAALSAAAVENAGTINATLGTVALGGAKAFTVDFTGDKLISYQITQPVDQVPLGPDGTPVAALVSHSGTIAADGGRVVMAAAAAKGIIDNAINLAGVVQANTIRSDNGVIVVGAVELDAGANGLQVSGQVAAHGAAAGGGTIAARGDSVTITSGAALDATGATTGGRVAVVAASLINHAGVIDASGATGGTATIDGAVVINQGTVRADGTSGAGGNVAVTVERSYADTEGATLSARGASRGGTIAVTGKTDSAVFASGRMDATSSAGVGGAIAVTAPTVNLVAAQLDASGATGGGAIKVGGDLHGAGTLARAKTTYVNQTATLKADATVSGDGGSIVVWSDSNTRVRGRLSARGGPGGGNGGTLEVSSKGTATMSGIADAGAPRGTAGSLLIDPRNIIIDRGGFQFDFIDPTPSPGNDFGDSVEVLSSGNIAITAPFNNAVASHAGAAYLFNGATGGLISTLTGSHASDQVGFNIVTLNNGNYLVLSPHWSGNAGAVTWASGATGVSGTLSAANSLVGSHANDRVGETVQTTFSGSDPYVVVSHNWTNGAAANAGAVTWASRATGVRGMVSEANSLVGSHANDRVGANLSRLPNGRFLLVNQSWNGNRGAVTLAPAAGVMGSVSAANSLVGTHAGDQVGSSLLRLNNGNYLVASQTWHAGTSGEFANAGAVTFVNIAGTLAGAVSAANSLVGTHANDSVGSSINYFSYNDVYVVRSPNWATFGEGSQANAGAITWGSTTTGVAGQVSSTTSLVGSHEDDRVGAADPLRLFNNKFLVVNQDWNSNRGAVTLTLTTGAIGGVSSTNSLVGSSSGDHVGSDLRFLSDGNLLVRSPNWRHDIESANAGALTWINVTTGAHSVGAVSSSNSLVGSHANDSVGSGGVTRLSNGKFVVQSPNWNGGVLGRGAFTLTPVGGMTDVVAASNSLVGNTAGDHVSSNGYQQLSNGNLLVLSPFWHNGGAANVGAVTWVSLTSGIGGVLSASNSLVGTHGGDGDNGDRVGSDGVRFLANGNYLVLSPHWANGEGGSLTNAGALTWGNASTGVRGAVSSSNSLVGSHIGDSIGSNVWTFGNGNYLDVTRVWNASRGAVTFGNGTTGITGVVSATTSLIGSQPSDFVGQGFEPNYFGGRYAVFSPFWHNGVTNNAGAITWASTATGVKGVVSASNSLVGSHTNDNVGRSDHRPTQLSNGKFLLLNPLWNGNRGAITLAPVGGMSGTVATANSLVGSQAGDQVGSGSHRLLDNSHLVALSPHWKNGGAADAGAVTWINIAVAGPTGTVSASNSLVGSHTNDLVGGNVQTFFGSDRYAVLSPNWTNGGAANAGAITWAPIASGVTGAVSASNSLVGSHANDRVGDPESVTRLSNGKFLVTNPDWNGTRGAVTLTATTGATGTVSSANSLVGSTAGDRIGDDHRFLVNGNLLVVAPNWKNVSTGAANAGAVTFVNIAGTLTGAVSEANSLVGSHANDRIGADVRKFYDFSFDSSNSNYLVVSPNWANGGATNAGAVTWGSGTTGVRGAVSATNSLVGGRMNDRVGSSVDIPYYYENSSGIYTVRSPNWNNVGAANAGAITWARTTAGVRGVVSETNSLVGSHANDRIGQDPVGRLSNGKFTMSNPQWSGNRGAFTLTPVGGMTGTVSAANSLVGTQAGDRVGSRVQNLFNGNLLVLSENWANGAAARAGAVTFVDIATGRAGAVSAANSLVGSHTNDRIGSSEPGEVETFFNGNYLVVSPQWNGNRGAVTWGSGTIGVSGVVSEANSLVGSHTGDRVGDDAFVLRDPVTFRATDTYVVNSPNWTNGPLRSAGAVTFGSTTGPTTGVVSEANSIVGRAADRSLSFDRTYRIGNDDYFLATADSLGQVSAVSKAVATRPAESQITDAGGLVASLNTGTAMRLEASNDITVNRAIETGPNAGALTLVAGHSITLNARITTGGANLFLTANSPSSDHDATLGGVTMAADTLINIGTGRLEMQAGTGRIQIHDVVAGATVLGGAITASRLTVGSLTVRGPSADIRDSSVGGASGRDGARRVDGPHDPNHTFDGCEFGGCVSPPPPPVATQPVSTPSTGLSQVQRDAVLQVSSLVSLLGLGPPTSSALTGVLPSEQGTVGGTETQGETGPEVFGGSSGGNGRRGANTPKPPAAQSFLGGRLVIVPIQPAITEPGVSGIDQPAPPLGNSARW